MKTITDILKQPIIALIVLIAVVLIGWQVFTSDVPKDTTSNTTPETTEEVTADTDVSAARALGVIQSDYLTDEDFQTYINETLDELVRIERADILDEAVAVIDETQNAIDYLADEKPAKAEKSIERALGKLEATLVIEPDAANLPIVADAEIHSLITDKATLEALKTSITAAVERGDLQRARELMVDLQSEIRLETINIPLEAHGIALRAAVKLIDEEKYVEAREVLRVAMNTLVAVERRIPIPLLNAELLVDESAQVVENDPQTALGMLSEAREQVEIAELLGYGFVATTDYQDLFAELTELEAKINEKKNTDQAYQDLAQTIEDLRVKITN